MKTAEEWKILLKDRNHPLSKLNPIWIKQIQLDAAKWGAEQAITPMLDVNGCSRRDVRQAILTFASNLTIDQLPK